VSKDARENLAGVLDLRDIIRYNRSMTISEVTAPDPYVGHPLKPIPLRSNPTRTEKVATYVELGLLKFYEEYAARCGFRSVSEAVRRLSIIGAMAEGYKVDEG
jgi:hypothetical protein